MSALLTLALLASTEPAHAALTEKQDVVSVVMSHITDSRAVELQTPWGPKYEWTAPEWKIHLGSFTLDLTITKHVFWLLISAMLTAAILLWATSGTPGGQVPGGFKGVIEGLVLYIRDEIAVKNMGEHAGHEFTPYLCTVFFFVLFCGMVGVLPFTATATGNIAVTLSLALVTFALTQIAGMRGQGVVGYWTHLVPAGVPWWLYPIVLPVEILGLFTKPFALTVRLFANMIAGHIVILFLLGLIFILGSIFVAPISVAFAVGIYLLELIVVLIQAYIFTVLSALFIGMAAHSH